MKRVVNLMNNRITFSAGLERTTIHPGEEVLLSEKLAASAKECGLRVYPVDEDKIEVINEVVTHEHVTDVNEVITDQSVDVEEVGDIPYQFYKELDAGSTDEFQNDVKENEIYQVLDHAKEVEDVLRLDHTDELDDTEEKEFPEIFNSPTSGRNLLAIPVVEMKKYEMLEYVQYLNEKYPEFELISSTKDEIQVEIEEFLKGR